MTGIFRRLSLFGGIALLVIFCAQRAISSEVADPYLWLESLDSSKSSAWVSAENAKTLSRLQSDPRFPALESEALAVFESDDRIAEPTFLNGLVYTFWQGREHRQGEWRSTTLSDYLSEAPKWRSVLDLSLIHI